MIIDDKAFTELIEHLESMAIQDSGRDCYAGWNAALKNCVYKLYNFFERGVPPIDVIDKFPVLLNEKDSIHKGFKRMHLKDVSC